MSRLSLIVALLAASIACSDSASLMTDASPTDDTWDSGNDDTGDTDTDPAEPPAWLVLEGTVSMEAGLATEHAMQASTLAADQTLICAAAVAAEEIVPSESTDPDVTMYGWWTLTTVVADTCNGVPSTFQFGIGEWDVRLDPPATAAGYTPTALNALYYQPGPTLSLAGAAGPAEQFAGTSAPQDLAPLPDGTYSYTSLFLLPVE